MFDKNNLVALLTILLIAACSDRANDPVVNLGAAPEITAPTGGNTFVLIEEEAEEIVTTFSWTAADFGFEAGINYTLEIDREGNEFLDATGLNTTSDLTYTELKVGRLNNILLANSLPAEFENPLEIRVCASVSNLVEPLCSPAVALKVSPYPAEVEYPVLGVPGQYQGWDETSTAEVIYSRNSDDIYEGYLYFGVDMSPFKFTRGFSWDENWGDDEADGILNPGGFGNDILLSGSAGMYFLRADLNTLEHSNTRTDWGVLGTATPTGTDSDTDLTWDETNEVLTITMDLTVGTLRFRANDANDINFGDNFSNGTLEADGDDIMITEAGNYTINMKLNIGDYKVELIKN